VSLDTEALVDHAATCCPSLQYNGLHPIIHVNTNPGGITTELLRPVLKLLGENEEDLVDPDRHG